jgi:hypothetical protein
MTPAIDMSKKFLVQVRIDGPTYGILDDVAKDIGVPIAELVRRMIYEAITPSMKNVFKGDTVKDNAGNMRLKRGRVKANVKNHVLQRYK